MANNTIMRFGRDILPVLTGYWKSEEKKAAWSRLLGIVALTSAAVYMTLLLNDWFNDFYGALQNYDREGIYGGLIRFTELAFAHIVFSVYAFYLQQSLALRWRQWMTGVYLGRWTENDLYYKLDRFTPGEADNPDQRIAEDVNLFTAQTLSLAVGLLRAITTLICFVFVLWTLSEPLVFSLLGQDFTVEGYLVWAAVIYSVVGTRLVHTVGKRLTSLYFTQQKREADFRFSLIRLRETGESVAFYGGVGREKESLLGRFFLLLDTARHIIRKQKQLSWITNGYGQAAIIFPFVVATPRYLSQHISLGGLMQIANCFGKVQESLSYFVDVYTTLAEWRACGERLLSFSGQMAEVQRKTSFRDLHINRGEDIALDNVTIRLPDGTPLLDDASVFVRCGERVILKGASGSGKSTLLRTLAGLWPYATGTMILPSEKRSMFIPQKPYLPLGTLREVVVYPQRDMEERILPSLLKECGLAHLVADLDVYCDWSHILSLGEQQKISFLRIFLCRPTCVFLDEATSAMDEGAERDLYGKLCALPGVTVISVGHRSTLDEYHGRTFLLKNKKILEI